MLDTQFPRPVGDIGNPESFDCPVLYETVPNASVSKATAPDGPDNELLAPFHSALKTLITRGADVLGTSCGFLAPFQSTLSSTLNKRFVASSLLALPALQRQFGGAGSVGVLTFSAAKLGKAHFDPLNIPVPPLAGIPETGHLATVIRNNRNELNISIAEAEVVDAFRHLQRQSAGAIRAILLECTNLGPYQRALEAATGLPVYDCVWVLENHETVL